MNTADNYWNDFIHKIILKSNCFTYPLGFPHLLFLASSSESSPSEFFSSIASPWVEYSPCRPVNHWLRFLQLITKPSKTTPACLDDLWFISRSTCPKITYKYRLQHTYIVLSTQFQVHLIGGSHNFDCKKLLIPVGYRRLWQRILSCLSFFFFFPVLYLGIKSWKTPKAFGQATGQAGHLNLVTSTLAFSGSTYARRFEVAALHAEIKNK